MEPKLVAQRSLLSYMPSTPTPTSSASATPFPASSSVTPSPSLARRQPLIPKEPAKPANRFAEAAGATAAECAAICCCCPCGLLNLVVLAAVKFPAGLLRQAVRRRRKRSAIVGAARKKAGPNKVGAMDDDDDFSIHGGRLLVLASGDDAWPRRSPSPELSELEKEMRALFYSAGFWRSPSQREEVVIKI
ncbi:uncharacterized protein LOC103700136 [Phoenix dactylifera]|uniref:Uncharacterized protein LOC103700136 n=1 Tax=Phoenix dactylifera TaxID=42345 RepID=A0A8B7MSG9_PHODC|nr:uncharacterized protein LOC103700136 [Phoenix dactylifera]